MARGETTNKEVARFSTLVNSGVPPVTAARQMGKTADWARFWKLKLGLTKIDPDYHRPHFAHYIPPDEQVRRAEQAVDRLRRTVETVFFFRGP